MAEYCDAMGIVNKDGTAIDKCLNFNHASGLSRNGLTASTAVAHCGEVLARTDVASVKPAATLMVVVMPQKRSFVALLTKAGVPLTTQA